VETAREHKKQVAQSLEMATEQLREKALPLYLEF
jgi:hypothetical protein